METIESVMFFKSSAWDGFNDSSGNQPARDAAVSQIGHALGRKRALAALVLALAALTARAPLAQAQGSRDLCLRGEREMQAGDLAGALESFRTAREILGRERPQKEEVADFLALHLYNLGVRFNNSGDAPRALDCFLEALRVERLRPGLRDAPFRKTLHKATLAVAGHLGASGRPATAIEAYSLLEGIAGGDPQDGAEIEAGRGRIELAAAGTNAERLAAAERSLRRAYELDPGSGARLRELASALSRLAGAQERAGRLGDASETRAQVERLYREALKLEPDSPWGRIDLAGYLLLSRRYEEAARLLADAEVGLRGLLAAVPQRPDAEATRRALLGCRESRAIALYNLAVDAINRAAFEEVEARLRDVCPVSPAWEASCRALRSTARAREESFRQTVQEHDRALSANPSSAADLLALGDLYASFGAWEKALSYYIRLEALHAQNAGLADRIASVTDPGRLAERRKVIDTPGGGVELVFYRETAAPDLETAVKAAELRVAALLGVEATEGPLRVTLYPNRRAFREQAGYRVGAFVKGNYANGQISFFEAPSQSVVEWVSVLTHELAHHAVARLSGGQAPRWLSEGIARYVEGETEVVNRRRLAQRLSSPGLPPLTRLDDLADRSWNDIEVYLDMRDEALLAVDEMARRRGGAGLRDLLTALLQPSTDLARALERVLGASLDQIDQAWRASLKRDLREPAP